MTRCAGRMAGSADVKRVRSSPSKEGLAKDEGGGADADGYPARTKPPFNRF